MPVSKAHELEPETQTPILVTLQSVGVGISKVLVTLSDPPRLRLTIERGAYTKAVVRCFFEDSLGRRSCLDSRLMSRTSATNLARAIALDGTEVEVVAFKYNCIRPAPWNVRRTKRLDAVRLNRVPQLISAASLFLTSNEPPITMENEDSDEAG